ncbi:MAG TPA: hypothetical protein VK538_02925 [Solirubrobacteraceae bacterium]|nr:hypothetical protein [Solirubrobacteraceae bacterium]
MSSAIRQRRLALIVVPLASVALSQAGAAASTGAAARTYGKLVVRHVARAAATLETDFVHVRPARSFLLVVTEPSEVQLAFSWSVHCFNPAHRESGGAEGEATITSGHWVKHVRADWIRHPAYCTGSVTGTAGTSPVLVRVFAG